MAKKQEKVEITGEDIVKYLNNIDTGAAADKLHELVTNINTLVNRIQDLIAEDQMLSVVSAVSFSAVLTAAGKPQVVAMMGADKDIIIGLRAFTDNFKELYMNKKEESDND